MPRKAPSAWITADRLVASGASTDKKEKKGKEKKEDTAAAGGRHAQTGSSSSSSSGGGAGGPGSHLSHLVSLDARVLARECLKEVGRELGVPR